MSTMLNWAIWYRSQNLSIIPVQGKTPLVPWKIYQTEMADENQIKAWWEKWPEADLGCVTGTISNRLVLDVDGEDGATLVREKGVPETYTVKTKKGTQYHFRWPVQSIGKTTLVGIAQQLDVRGEAGYCKLPPSKFSDDSGRYQSDGTADCNNLAQCPDWLLKLLEEKNKPKERSIDRENGESWLSDIFNSLKEGNRNESFTRVAGSLRSRGYSASDIYSFLADKAESVGFDLSELRTICESVATYAPRVSTLNTEAQSIDEFLENEQKVEWLVPGIISKGSIGFVAGLQEVYKTWLLIDLAIEMAKGGGHWLGKFPTKAAKVLFVDQERHRSETQRRFKAVLAEKGIHAKDIHNSLVVQSGTSTRLNLPQSFEAFTRKLSELKPDVVMVDSWATFHTSPENDRTEIQKVLELVKQMRNEHGCTFIFINHEGKSILHNEPGTHKEPHSADMMGSVAVPAAAEVVLTVRRKDNDTCMVYQTKNTNGPKIEPFEVTVRDMDEGKTKIKVEAR